MFRPALSQPEASPPARREFDTVRRRYDSAVRNGGIVLPIFHRRQAHRQGASSNTKLGDPMKQQTISKTTTDTELVIPSKALARLPLSPQAVQDWDQSSDIYGFLLDLYSSTGYGEVAEPYLCQSIEEFHHIAQHFFNIATTTAPTPGSVCQAITVPDFTLCPYFGLMAKHMCAWDHIVGNMLAESNFFSLPHLLETQSDLRSSINLSANLFYRQSFMVIRCFIESVVLPIYFCMNPAKYSEWKNDTFHTPPLRGRNGLLQTMVQNGVLPQDISDDVSNLYGNLNAYIHGSENALNNSGLPDGTWEGHIFRPNEYNKWTDMFTRTVVVAIKLMRIHHNQWENSLAHAGIVCRVCHGTIFTISDMDAKLKTKSYKCDQCGNTFHLDHNKEHVVITTIEIEQSS